MVKTDKLLEIIKSKGLKITFIAQKVGLSYYGFYKKLHNQNEFTVSEVRVLSDLLGLTLEQTHDIFFTLEVDHSST